MKGPKGKYAWTVKVGAKGAYRDPKQAREAFEIEPGDAQLLLGDVRRGLAVVRGDRISELMGRALGAAEDGA